MTLVWRPGFQFDADASTYIEAVEAADTQALETGVRYAINDFVIGCKNDGIWDAIKASCILAGARTLAGALVPLVGTAPTNYNFVAGDYNRETGLVGDGSTKYLNSNRNNNADPQNNKHLAVYATTHHTRSVTRGDLSGGGLLSGNSELITTTTQRIFRVNRTGAPLIADLTAIPGLWAASRISSSQIQGRYQGTTSLYNDSSLSPSSGNFVVFARLSDSAVISDYSNARLAFYSIGESLDLAKLDTRVSALITAIGAAIP